MPRGPIDAVYPGMKYTREIIWNMPSRRRRTIIAGSLIAAALTLTTGLALSRPRPATAGQDASRQVMRLAFESFPRWRVEHPEARCPERLGQLVELDRADHIDQRSLDPWGHAFQYTCDPRLLRTKSPGIEITSAGEDGTFGTRDDVRSDR